LYPESKPGNVKGTKLHITLPPAMLQLVQALDLDPHADLIKQVNALLEQRSRVIEQEPAAFLDTLFLKAISDRFGNTQQTGHLYLAQYEIPQIVLFDVLINKFPFVRTAHGIVNDTIVTAIDTAQQVVLLDVGIGRGIQTVRLMQSLQDHPTLQHLTIIGVEAFKEALGHAQQVIREAAAKASYQVAFEGINCLVEDIDAATLQNVLPSQYDKLIVNASLTLHHIQTHAQRHAFFDRLRQLSPDDVLLTEPHSDHFEPSWMQRVQNAYTHYAAVFSVIDCLDVDIRTRNGLKLFFGREIEDVVAHAEVQRYERHEPAEQWLDYCTTNGFKISRDFTLSPGHQSPFIQLQLSKAGYLAMEHGGLNVLSLIHATSENEVRSRK
jgi:hypothetical protein